MALRPTQFQPGLASGSRARRAGTALVPMCSFQASELGRPRMASKPTPMELLGGRSAIIVLIRFTASGRIFILKLDPREPRFCRSSGRVHYQYESTWGGKVSE